MAVLLGVFLGISGAAGYFTWFIGQRLPPALSDEHLPDYQRALLCFGISHTIFFLVIPWDCPPLTRGLISCSVGLLAEALTIISIHVAFVTWNWSTQLEEDGSMNLARHCRAMAIYLSVLWCLGWLFFMLSLSYILDFGVPDFVKQMLVDTRKLLAATGLKSLPGQSDINKEDSVLEKAPNRGMV
ncbi:uncharacterized protein BKA55DRAFT_580558 [Fusarium redolens]|uniref:Uncharacterized protein n=1 Tax=Fusarium redolens TaxID=48865 RepID=A0A9P9G9W8_FUSRE|nr:uncharacterized protein BKA55DRAFT_580558 [Fusarium redolens]KAH7233949.1 hypothetical protein BKA55DRAFT_580558 [Fusarium redolens]